MHVKDSWVLIDPKSLLYMRKLSDTAPEYECIGAFGSKAVGYYAAQRHFNLDTISEDGRQIALDSIRYTSYESLKIKEGDAAEQILARAVFEALTMPGPLSDRYFSAFDGRIEQAIQSVAGRHTVTLITNWKIMASLASMVQKTNDEYFQVPGAADAIDMRGQFDNGFSFAVHGQAETGHGNKGAVTITFYGDNGKTLLTDIVEYGRELTHTSLHYEGFISTPICGNIKNAGTYEVVITA